METLINNTFVRVERTEDGISFFDLTDKWNGTAGYTKGKRGLDRAAKYLAGLAPTVKSNVRMGDVTDFLAHMNLKPHTYCSMD